jgi:hypothetical protein
MVEQIKKINNPLTIIAIFAALAEINATVSIGLIDKSLHYIFIWFLIGFPLILVFIFFVTLNFNTRVMYSPSDYKDDKSFIDTLFGSGSNKDAILPEVAEGINKSIEKLERKIAETLDIQSQRPTKKTYTEEEVKGIIEKLKIELKSVSDEVSKTTGEYVLNIPSKLLKQIIKWSSYPAFIPLIYPIVKEGLTSSQELSHEGILNSLELPWLNGLNRLIKDNILIGTKNKFKINPEFEDGLNQWVNLNDEILREIISIFSENKYPDSSFVINRARSKAQKLIY